MVVPGDNAIAPGMQRGAGPLLQPDDVLPRGTHFVELFDDRRRSLDPQIRQIDLAAGSDAELRRRCSAHVGYRLPTTETREYLARIAPTPTKA